MPEVIFNGPAGRLQGRYQPGKTDTAPVALILHAHPQYGGNMDNKVPYYLFHAFSHRGFATLRFNFRGVGRSQGEFDNGAGELSDAASALDWLQSMNSNSTGTWVAGFSFGAWISMQLLMRRPEIQGFISVAPPANRHDFTFLAPCPSSGLIIQAEDDEIITPISVVKLVEKLKAQKSITINHDSIKGANHFFENHLSELMGSVNSYLNQRLAGI
ncbi:alpha/beta hydrolase [Yunchengibacter salinarum]|uniref:alpha/beta hydrolase n=1 Tax=Yunchengibacter salinarum TaxID=3133399 RepID=UPI0035B5C432